MSKSSGEILETGEETSARSSWEEMTEKLRRITQPWLSINGEKVDLFEAT